ncbi:TPA: hypothetical protein CPT80_04275 [Candidatus Gastranaerophilales bacterium HUM_9]|nr:MAG TPA: hypothetical protein CPT80_04275 [Candidatus Gastranaerophilales bacterium HUM_9]HBX35002.1 hypothetical protein [Cyanobacteria bacterium UBA11440]
MTTNVSSNVANNSATTTTSNIASNVNANINGVAQMGQYSFMDTPMANDVFGSQVFGSNPFGYQQQPTFTTAPNDLASALVQQAVGGSATNSAPTIQDYYQATQVANMFMNPNSMSMSPYTSYTQNDIFAQQAMPLMFNNGQAIA